MNDVTKAQKALDWLKAHIPEQQWFSAGVCTVSGFDGMPEIYLLVDDIEQVMPGEGYTIVFDHKRQLAFCVMVNDGIAVTSCRYCKQESPGEPVVIPPRTPRKKEQVRA